MALSHWFKGIAPYKTQWTPYLSEKLNENFPKNKREKRSLKTLH
jgi:hypothetical protein